MKSNEIIQGDSLEELKKLEENSIDLIATDPPYGYSFMGKDWDKAVPSVELWKECLRVLKPGAFCMVMSAPRQDVLSQMIVRIGEAGFDTSFTSIYWTYASGFPKASNIGKMVDKRGGQYLGKEVCDIIKKKRLEMGLSTIELAELGKFYGKVNHGGTVSNWEEGKGTPTPEQYNKLIDILKIGDNPIIATTRELISKDKNWGKRGSTPLTGYKDFDVTKGKSELEGSYGGFQPKPAVEVIIVAMKPCTEKTYVDQALKNRKGITWLDDCRIPYESESLVRPSIKRVDNNIYGKGLGYGTQQSPTGRFPANLLVSDDVLNDGRITNNARPNQTGKKTGSDSFAGRGIRNDPQDSGSFSRYFNLDKWYGKLD